MLDAFWSWLKDPANQQVLTWIGGGFVVFVGGVWAVVKFFAKKDGGAGGAAQSSRADRGGVSIVGSVLNSPITARSDEPIANRDHKTKS